MPATCRASAFEQQHREEQGGLVAGDPAPDAAAPGAGLRLGEHDATGIDVRVAVDVVGVGVVAVVLVDPPAVAQPDQQVRAQQAQQVVVAPGAEDLPMAGVVAEEADLGEHDRQERRDDQLPPRRPEPERTRSTPPQTTRR